MNSSIPILLYHWVPAGYENGGSCPWDLRHAVPFQLFRAQLRAIKRKNWLSTTPDFLTHRVLHDEPRHVLFTFDDGSESDHRVALELKEIGFSGTFFITWSNLGKPLFLNRGTVQRLAMDGFTIGSHGLTHTDLTEISSRRLKTELVESKRKLEDLIGNPIVDFAVPFGRYNSSVLAAALEAGYLRIMTSDYRRAKISDWPVYPRLLVTRFVSADKLASILQENPLATAWRRLAQSGARRIGQGSFW